MALTASKLRENIYRILDQVAETGKPVEISRKGKLLRIVADSSEQPNRSKLSRLKKRMGVIVGDPEDIVHMDWSKNWRKKK